MALTFIARAQDSEVERIVGHTYLAVRRVLQPQSDSLTILLGTHDFAPRHDLELPLTWIGFVQTLMVHGLVKTVQEFGANDAIVGGFVGEGGLLAGFGREAVEVVNTFRVEDFVYARVI